MVSKNLHVGIKIVIPINIDSWWICQRKRISLYMSFIQVNAILNHIDTRVILLRYKRSSMAYRPE